MIITTTDTIEGRQVRAYLGVVSGEAVAGTNFFKDFFAGITDIFGGRSKSYEDSLNKAKDAALEDLQGRADSLGADAIIGVDLDYTTLGGDGKTMLLCIANGTAVKLG